MAKLRVFSSIKNSVYTVRFENDVNFLSEQDKQLMEKFGEPEIDMGGVFLDNTSNEFELPTQYVKIRSGFPITKMFDAKGAPFDTNTVTKVDNYKATIAARFAQAFTDLRNNTDPFTDEELFDA